MPHSAARKKRARQFGDVTNLPIGRRGHANPSDRTRVLDLALLCGPACAGWTPVKSAHCEGTFR